MVKTINLTTNVAPNREVRITLPTDVPLGPAEIVVVVASHATAVTRTLGDLLRSEFLACGRTARTLRIAPNSLAAYAPRPGAAWHDGVAGHGRAGRLFAWNTFNLKHFQVIAGLDVATPYTRS